MTRATLKKIALALVIAAQIATLGYMAGNREYIVANGQQIFLRTAPIDPRDPFRGDYVRLSYAFNEVAQSHYQGATPIKQLRRSQRVYATLQPEGNGVFGFNTLTDETPASDHVFIAGRNNTSTWAQQERSYLDIHYGIEKYFVEQGKGRELEQKLGLRRGLQIPMEVAIALSTTGTAVITGHRWSALGVELDFDTPESDAEQDRSPVAIFSIVNVSSQPAVIITDSKQCVFRLEIHNAKWLNQIEPTGCENTHYQETTLAPGERWSSHIDLNAPQWFVPIGENTTPLHAIPGWNRAQLIYSPPRRDPAWYGQLRSPRFNANRRID